MGRRKTVSSQGRGRGQGHGGRGRGLLSHVVDCCPKALTADGFIAGRKMTDCSTFHLPTKGQKSKIFGYKYHGTKSRCLLYLLSLGKKSRRRKKKSQFVFT